MNKLIQAAEYFISVAEAEKHDVNEQGMQKLEQGNTGTDFDQLFARRQTLRAIIGGLARLQWHLGAPNKGIKALEGRKALKYVAALQKELAHYSYEDTEASDSFKLAREFVKTTVTGNDNVGLSIFDETDGATQQLTAIEGDGGLFDHSNPAHAPEYAPTH